MTSVFRRQMSSSFQRSAVSRPLVDRFLGLLYMSSREASGLRISSNWLEELVKRLLQEAPVSRELEAMVL